MSPKDTADSIAGALAAAAAPINANGVCELCSARFTLDQALGGGIGHHAAGCAWQRARALKGQVAEQLLAEQPRPAETPTSMAFRLVVAGAANAHRQLDDARFLSLLLALKRLAGELGCEVQLNRQVQKSMRDDKALENRLVDWFATAKLGDLPHAS